MNVYVSPQLREAMRRYDKRVTWSEVAANAFKEEIARQEHLDYTLRHARRGRRATLYADDAHVGN